MRQLTAPQALTPSVPLSQKWERGKPDQAFWLPFSQGGRRGRGMRAHGLTGGLGGILLTLLLTLPAQACSQDFEPLTAKLLSDLPSYANRVMQRSRSGRDYLTYVQLAGRADFQPLPLGGAEDGETRQVFFTTLEQQFTGDRALTRQHYHWLFLTPTDAGWAMVYLFTRFGEADPQGEPMPPRETSSGIMGQAITLWLRDCQAGAVRGANF